MIVAVEELPTESSLKVEDLLLAVGEPVSEHLSHSCLLWKEEK